MPLTPEQRAADIIDRYKTGEHSFGEMLEWLRQEIIRAIREAVADVGR